jgi:hypothetical protein
MGESNKFSVNQSTKICQLLDSLSSTGLEVSFYINDTLPKIIDEIKIKDNSFDQSPSTQLKAIIFVGTNSKEYDIHYSEFIRTNDYLRARHKFQTAIYNALKNEIDYSFFRKLVSEFSSQFADKKAI